MIIQHERFIIEANDLENAGFVSSKIKKINDTKPVGTVNSISNNHHTETVHANTIGNTNIKPRSKQYDMINAMTIIEINILSLNVVFCLIINLLIFLARGTLHVHNLMQILRMKFLNLVQ